MTDAPLKYGRYQLLKKLAAGGMAQVWLARQSGMEGFEKLLVIKQVLPWLAGTDEFITMFLDEARLAARLNHPNVVQVFDLGRADDETLYIAMEYIHGEDLRRMDRESRRRRLPVPIPLVCRIIADAAAGLHYAHTMGGNDGRPLGIVHRDVSPQNILVTFDGGVKVVDFGIAKAADKATKTRSGVLKGKYAYMSPEQAAGRNVDHRTDIFALGIMLHELLTGQRLFKRESEILTLHAVVRCEVPTPSRLNPIVPPGLDPVVTNALAKNPEDRYPTAQVFQLALEDFLIGFGQPSSSAHLSAYMRELFSERLDIETREGGPAAYLSRQGQTGSKGHSVGLGGAIRPGEPSGSYAELSGSDVLGTPSDLPPPGESTRSRRGTLADEGTRSGRSGQASQPRGEPEGTRSVGGPPPLEPIRREPTRSRAGEAPVREPTRSRAGEASSLPWESSQSRSISRGIAEHLDEGGEGISTDPGPLEPGDLLDPSEHTEQSLGSASQVVLGMQRRRNLAVTLVLGGAVAAGVVAALVFLGERGDGRGGGSTSAVVGGSGNGQLAGGDQDGPIRPDPEATTGEPDSTPVALPTPEPDPVEVPEQEPSTRPTTGRLKVSVAPADARVFVSRGDKWKGLSGSLSPGTHRLRIVLPDGAVHYSQAEVVAGRTRTVNLSYGTGTLRVLITRPFGMGGEVRVKGRVVGRIPGSPIKLYEGTHSVEVVGDGGASATRKVEIQAGQAETLTIQFD